MTDENEQVYEVHVSDSAMGAEVSRVLVTLTADGVVTPAPTDSLGLAVEQKLTLTKAQLSDGQYHYELKDRDGTVLDTGLGNSLSDALFGLAVGAEARELGEDDPDR